jgi:hypothetical protein
MDARAREIKEQGDQLFGKRTRVMNLWQELANNFYPERADFTVIRDVGNEFASHLMTGAPALFRRDLANNFSAMLRPRDKPWFRARTHFDHVNDDSEAKAFLDHISERMRLLMYASGTQFIRATKQGDNDFATFGQAVISIDPNSEFSGLLYRAWHLRDVAWCEDDELRINEVHHNWCLGARFLEKKYRGKVATAVVTAAEKEPYKDIKCRRVVIPADDYDFKQENTRGKRKLPYIAIDIDCDNDKILEEKPVKRINYIIPRWATVSGSQYAHSPATVIALPDARLLQQITLTLLEAGQKIVDPPWVATKEAIQGPMQMFAGGLTWVDREYDEKMGEAIRQMPIDGSGLRWGGERETVVMESIKAALFLNQIDVPYPEGDMTATEYRGRVEQYIMRALPLFEPMEVEYNGGLCEGTFDLLLDMNGFGSVFADMPQILRGQDIRWTFESPLQAATERAKSSAFMQTAELLSIAARADPTTVHDVDISRAFRDAITGTGAPADWVVPEEKANAAKALAAKMAQAQAQMAGVQQMAAAASMAGEAGQSISLGAKGLQEAGLV